MASENMVMTESLLDETFDNDTQGQSVFTTCDFPPATFYTTPSSDQFGVGASTSTPRSEVRRGTYTELLTSDTPPDVGATLDCGVAATVASSEALTEGLVTPERDRPPIVDERSDYMFA
ncbi:hypothetical protein SUGI_0252170, partial [Cryptomeria japonica]